MYQMKPQSDGCRTGQEFGVRRANVRTGKKKRGGALGKPMVELELGVCGGNCLAGHQIQFFFHLGIELDYVSQHPLQFSGSYDQILAHRMCRHVCYP